MTIEDLRPSLQTVSPRAVASPTDDCCAPGESCGCGPALGVSRRRFLGVGAGALALMSLPTGALAIPADKKFAREWVARIMSRGEATRDRGAALGRIGMPVGGIGTGQVYAAGDGRLWLWDVFNDDSAYYGGVDYTGVHYAEPLSVVSPFTSGFALRARSGHRTTTAALDATGFPGTTFTGRYPIGTVNLRGGKVPADVDLDVFTPFVPTQVADSELPVTVCEYTVRNTSSRTVDYELLGFSENPVALRSRTQQPITLTGRSTRPSGGSGLQFTAATAPVDDPTGDDVLFEDWSDATYTGWTVTGTAFGTGPVTESELPPEMTRFGGVGSASGRFVTSYAFRSGGAAPDAATGTLTSRSFTVTRRGLLTRVGGGPGPAVGLRVVVDGKVVASTAGLRYEPMRPVYLDLSTVRGKQAHIEIVDTATGAWGHVNCDRIVFTDRTPPAPEEVFEDWSSGTYANWTPAGKAFGTRPVTLAETPDYFRREGDLGVLGTYFVTSHDFRDHPNDGVGADEEKGTLTSKPFTVERRYLVANIGGGADSYSVGLRVVVDGEVVARLAGANSEIMSVKSLDLSPWHGKQATIVLEDDNTIGWGHVNCDRIWFSDLPVRVLAYDDLRDAGSFGLSVDERGARVRPSLSRYATVDDWFDAGAGPTTRADDTQGGAVSVRFSLKPGQHRTVRFVLAWNFPRLNPNKFPFLTDRNELRHHYATRFRDAAAVLDHLGRHGDRLSGDTHAFVETWYADTTLPNWFVERTLAPASTVGTETVQYFDTGRFYAWEGAYCCFGTCTHVWNYAQSTGYLFPALEQAARTVTDYGVAFHADTGAIDYRGEADRRVAHDGQCGNILRTYREHQMATSSAFLKRIWPQVKKATQYLIGHDGTKPNGIFETDQYNTLDATWYGEIPWISGLYVAALHAAAEMALDMGDRAFARQCRVIAASGTDYLDDVLWNSRYKYFEQKVDPGHPEATNSNRGCYIDQMFGQTYTHQLGLPHVFDDAKADTALMSIYRNNFMPDARSYMDRSGIDGGRIYATDGEAGTLMCTWPFGGQDEAPGEGNAGFVAYFNEVWTGTEWQFCSHLLATGHVEEGLAVARAIYDRYSASKRNPYNEIECSDHYARSMMSHSAYLAALGFEHHGPRGHLGFAPKIRPEDFRAAFTVGAGWGSYAQRRHGVGLDASVEMRYGRLDGLRTFTVEHTGRLRDVTATLTVAGKRPVPVRVKGFDISGSRVTVTFAAPVALRAGQTLAVQVR